MPATAYAIAPDVVAREHEGKLIVVDLKSGECFELNEDFIRQVYKEQELPTEEEIPNLRVKIITDESEIEAALKEVA